MLPKRNSSEYNKLRDHLNRLMAISESEMSKKWDSWDETEKHFQAYFDLRTTAKNRSTTYGSDREDAEYPGARPFVIPKSFSNVMTLTSHLHSTFTRRAPIFAVGAANPEYVKAARLMELHLQHQMRRTRGRLKLWFPISDALKFNIGVVHTNWTTHKRVITRQTQQPATTQDILGNPVIDQNAPPVTVEEREETVTFEGNEIQQIDPYCFFPDPRVPVCDMQQGEFMAWRDTKPLTYVLQLANEDNYDINSEFIEKAFEAIRSPREGNHYLGLRATAFPGDDNRFTKQRKPLYRGMVSQGTVILEHIYVDLVPSKYGLKVKTPDGTTVKGSSDIERWHFIQANFSELIYGAPLDSPNGSYPLMGGELFPDGHRFLQNISYQDLGNPFQQAASFLINSRMDNIRLSLNGMWVIDPTSIDPSDFSRSKHGKMIRLKQTARTRDVRAAITQLQVADITAGHVASIEQLLSLADRTLFNPSTIQGQVSTGRRPATEIVAASNAAGSIIRTFAELFSAALMEPLGELMIATTQDRSTIDQWMDITGLPNVQEFANEVKHGLMKISPDDFNKIAGGLYFVPHDGTSPIDPTVQANLAMQMIQVASNSPLLQAKLDLYELFKLWARGLSFQNLEAFELKDSELRDIALRQALLQQIPRAMEDNSFERELQAGNLAPASELGGSQPGNEGGGMNQLAALMGQRSGMEQS